MSLLIRSWRCCQKQPACSSTCLAGCPSRSAIPYGHYKKMNAPEHHRSSEFGAEYRDVIMFLALRQELSEALQWIPVR